MASKFQEELDNSPLSELQSKLKFFFLYVFVQLRFDKDNNKRRPAKQWIRIVSELIELILPDYNYIITNYPLESQDPDLTDVILDWFFAVEGDVYRVFVFAKGTMKFQKQTRKTFNFIYGRKEKVRKTLINNQHSGLKRFFACKPKKFALVFCDGDKPIEKETVILEAMKTIQEKLPRCFAEFSKQIEEISLKMKSTH